jgi:hypothetical protein
MPRRPRARRLASTAARWRARVSSVTADATLAEAVERPRRRSVKASPGADQRRGTEPASGSVSSIAATSSSRSREDEVRATYTPASAPCEPHFRWPLQAAADKTVLDCLVAAERRRVKALLAAEPGAGWRAGLAHVAGAARVMTARGQGW